MSSGTGSGETQLSEIVRGLAIEELQAVLLSASERHMDVERQVRLAASRRAGDLAALRTEVDRGLGTRRFLGYRESSEWARGAGPIVEELRLAIQRAPSNDLVLLLERAVERVVKVILRADDSDGAIGDLARELLDLHASVCETGVADPIQLASWMVRFSCDDQDFFEVDPVRYAGALGERGLIAYRRAITQRADAERNFAVRYARERLAVLDGDTEAIVEQLGGDLSSPHQFIRVGGAMSELGRDDDVLFWARRGIDETKGWQVAQLYDLACAVHERRGAHHEVLALRREAHERMPSTGTYRALRRAAEPLSAWPPERENARRALRERDRGSLVDALLEEGDTESAWEAGTAIPAWDPGRDRRTRLAEAREPSHPDEALAWYLLAADEILLDTGRAAYARAISVLKNARRAAAAANQTDALAAALSDLRERHRRRPTLIAMLDKANLP